MDDKGPWCPIFPNCNLEYNLGSYQGTDRRPEGIIVDFKKEGVLKIEHPQYGEKFYRGCQKNRPFFKGFFLQPLIPPFRISELIFKERYNWQKENTAQTRLSVKPAKASWPNIR